MHSTPKLPDITLQLFAAAAEEEDVAAKKAGEAAAQRVSGKLSKAEAKQRSGGSRRSFSGELSKVVYGKQEGISSAENGTPDAGENKATDKAGKESDAPDAPQSLEAKRKAFRELIEGEYKDVYTEEIQRIINNRFKDTKRMEKSLTEQKPILDMLLQKYAVADGDLTRLREAMERDESYWSEAALAAGLTVEQYKVMQQLQRENEELRRIRRRQLGEQQAQRQIDAWVKEGEALKEVYADFDFRKEAANKDFTDLLKAGIPVRKAYELIHFDELQSAAAKAAAETAGEQVLAKLKSKAQRPQENGTSSQSAAITKSDVHSLSRADRAEIARRAHRGDLIRF